MSLAIVGTGTGVGKTVVSAVLLARWAGRLPLAYWKPVATGSREERDAETVAALLGGGSAEILPETYLFPEPLSPHLAARLAGEAIDPARILADWRRHRAAQRAIVIEGAGGLLVPLTDEGYLLADLVVALGVPCLLVAASGLGTINHTLLTLEAMRFRRLDVAGVVLNGPPNPENRLAIERLGRIEVIAEIDTLAPLDSAGVARAAHDFDPDGRLLRHLGTGEAAPERRAPAPSGPTSPDRSPVPAASDRLAVPAPLDRSAVPEATETARSPGAVRDTGGPGKPDPQTQEPADGERSARRAPLAPGAGMEAGSSASPEPDWLALDRRHVWHPYTQMLTAPPPIPVARAEGVYLHTPDGRRILDAISSWWVNVHGHDHPRLNRALAEQANRLEQVIFAGFAHEPGARLAAALSARSPGRLPRVFYSDNGSTAVEVALKMAWQLWRNRGERGRDLFVAFDDAYHGDTFGAMAAGGMATFHGAFGDLLFSVRRASTPHSAARGSASPPLAEILHHEGHRVAAVIVEPMLQGAGGMIVHPPAFLAGIRDETRRLGIPLIADEVLTGFGRTGRLFACEHAGVEPDLLCLSKALTGGYLPFAATLATEDVYAAFLSEDRSKTLYHGHSYTGNALACAVALESLALLEESDALARVQRLERLFAVRLARLATHPRVAATRHLGGMAALEIAPASTGGYLDTLGPRLAAALLARDVLLRPLGNVLYVLPPYVITDDEVHHVFDAIEEVLAAL